MAKIFAIAACLLVAFSQARGQGDACPEKNGFFADALQCDRYYECKDFNITDKLCPDGMVFADLSIERCDFPFNVDCKDRPETQPPNPSTNCPRRNGYFAHPDPTVCNQFFFCSDGQFNLITCPDGLVFNDKTGTCSWPGDAGRVGCGTKEVVNFVCPTLEEEDPSGTVNPLYADPEDCQYFYVCINSRDPRRNGCTTGQVFNDVTKRCDKPRNVPECKDWYKTDDADEDSDDSEEVVVTTTTKKPKNRTKNRS